jgi:peptide/nickel transport system substrate-binding protein
MKKLTTLSILGFVLILAFGTATAQDMIYAEAPMLAALVEAGELPPLEERLPSEPLVIEPYERIGDYGGEWRSAMVGGLDHIWMIRLMAYENLIRFTPDWSGLMPGVAKSFSGNAEATEFIFELREGLRWSDGAPFTADDITFWYEDILTNEDLTPTIATWLVSGGEPLNVEKVDHYTVKFTFSTPNGLFLQNLASILGCGPTSYPRHYLEPFHIDYAEDMDAMIEEAGASDWVEVFQAAGGVEPCFWTNTSFWQTTEIPTMHAWRLISTYGGGSGRVVAERNPYYYKVDPAGNHLPYIDSISRALVTDLEVENLKIIAGETDIQGQFIRLSDYPMFSQNQEAGNYHLLALPAWQDQLLIFPFNFDPADPVLGEIIRDKRFRQALSLAVDRDEVKKSIFLDFGVPSAFAPVAGSPWYKDEFRDAYAQYDVDAANALLDEMGLEWDENNEYRLRPDGERLILPIDYYDVTPPATPGGELIREFWVEIGVDTKVEQVNGQFYWQKRGANETVGTIWWANGLSPADAVFVSSFLMTPSWWTWYNAQGADGTEPQIPEAVELVELFWELQTATTNEEQVRLGIEIFENHKENVWNIGTVASAPQPFVYNQGLGNISVAEEREYYHISLMELSEQFYWK